MFNDSNSSASPALWLEFPPCDYARMHTIQQRLRQKRQTGAISDVILLLEHTPCITIGSSGGRHNLLANDSILEHFGITVHETSRGGDITYHGPGQLVCYPILSLQGSQRDLHAYARNMEEVMIRTLKTYGISAGRKPKFPGVWVGEDKIGAMGIAVRKWTTMHGISLNVCPDLHHFSLIVPCGIANHGVTSMAHILNQPPDITEVRAEMRRQFAEIFHLSLQTASLEQLSNEACLETT